MTSPRQLEDPFELTGTVLEGQYRADGVVGEGGFGVVYRGKHLSLEQPIAIKVLKGLDGGDPTINALVLEKFRAEARLLYTLSQSSLHIVRALDYGATTMPSGAWAPFMVLEWLEGRSLADDLGERRSRGMRGRSVDEALAILEPAAEGLSVAHQRQVAHRDVKPANVFLLPPAGRGPEVKVLDFGIAKIMKEGEAAGTKGTFASFTWQYAAPEQLDPRLGATGFATDVYAFGLLITELLTDRKPIDERDVVGIMRAAMDPHRRPTPRTRGANVPDALEAVCLRALAIEPRNRYATVGELWAALASVGRGRGVTAMTAAAPGSVGFGPGSVGFGPGSVIGPGSVGFGPGSVVGPGSVGFGPGSVVGPGSVGFGPGSVIGPGSVVAPGRGTVPPAALAPPPAAPGPPPRPTGLPMSAPMLPNVPSYGGASPPPGTRPPGYPAGPPPGTPPPGSTQARPAFIAATGPSPVLIGTIIVFVVMLLFAGACGMIGLLRASG